MLQFLQEGLRTPEMCFRFIAKNMVKSRSFQPSDSSLLHQAADVGLEMQIRLACPELDFGGECSAATEKKCSDIYHLCFHEAMRPCECSMVAQNAHPYMLKLLVIQLVGIHCLLCSYLQGTPLAQKEQRLLPGC